MEDLRIWFLESRIRLLWPGISDKSWSEFLVEEAGKNKKLLKEFLDSAARDKVREKNMVLYQRKKVNLN